MQRVLLTATTRGLSASFLSQPVEVPRVREELRRALGGTLVPQTVLRLGCSTPVPPTPRHPLSELVVSSDEHAPCQVPQDLLRGRVPEVLRRVVGEVPVHVAEGGA